MLHVIFNIEAYEGTVTIKTTKDKDIVFSNNLIQITISPREQIITRL